MSTSYQGAPGSPVGSSSAVFGPDNLGRIEDDARTIMARYPVVRSALLPMLHLVQSEQGYVSPEGIEFCARMLDLSTAEVSAVATFYTMYKRRPVGDFHVGVCTNTLCAVMGGDAIFSALKEHLDVGNDEMTADGMITLEHIECNAACDYAPVMTVNWEFYDNQTPSSAREVVDSLREGTPIPPTRGAGPATFTQTERLLAGFYDGRAGEGPGAGPASRLGLTLIAEQRDGSSSASGSPAPGVGRAASAPEPGEPLTTGYGAQGGPSGNAAPMSTSASDPDHAHDPADEHDPTGETRSATTARTNSDDATKGTPA